MTYRTRILVAVEDRRRREPIVTRLSLAGFPTRTASSGREAIEQLKGSIDAVILDTDIPGRSCIEVLSWMQRTGRVGRVPALLIAANPRLDVLRAAGEMGVRACLRTPVNEIELLGRLRAMLADVRQRNEHRVLTNPHGAGAPVQDCAKVEVVAEQMSVDLGLGLRISAARGMVGLTQNDLAQRILVPESEIGRIERGEAKLSAAKLHAIAEALNLPLGHFFDRASG